MSKKRRNQSHGRAARGERSNPSPDPPQPRRWAVWAVRAGVCMYVLWLLVVPPQWLEPAIRSWWRAPQIWMRHLLHDGLTQIGFDKPSRFVLAQAYYLVLGLTLPALVCVLLGRGRPADTGWRRPNRYLFRIVGCSYLVAIPFLYWMVQSPGFVPYYRSHVAAEVWTVVIFFVVMLFCEHFLFEGVMLAAFRAGGRWPAPARCVQDAPSGWRRLAQWFGIAQPIGSARGLQRATRWLGIPDGCVGAILLSGVLFGLVHWGKAGREFLLAFPGGIFLSALAYRCNSWHAPYLLHAGTVTVSALMFLALQK